MCYHNQSHMHKYTNTNTYTHKSLRHIHTFIPTKRLQTNTHTQTHTHRDTYTHPYTKSYIPTHTHIYIDIYTLKYTIKHCYTQTDTQILITFKELQITNIHKHTLKIFQENFHTNTIKNPTQRVKIQTRTYKFLHIQKHMHMNIHTLIKMKIHFLILLLSHRNTLTHLKT